MVAYRRFGVERPFFQLAHHLVLKAPWLSLLRRCGTVEASWENARVTFETEAAALVYPGGDWEAHRPTWPGRRIELAGPRELAGLRAPLAV